MKATSNKKDKKILITKISFWLGLISTILFLVLISLSHYYAIKSGYDWLNFELSELVLDNTTAKILFNIACIQYGIFLILFLIPLGFKIKEKKSKIAYYILSLVVGISLIGIGAFSEDEFYITHYVFAVIFFTTAGILIAFVSTIHLLQKLSFPIWIVYYGYFTFFFLLFHVITRWFFGRSFTQRIAILLAMFYLLIIGGYNSNQSDLT